MKKWFLCTSMSMARFVNLTFGGTFDLKVGTVSDQGDSLQSN
jgi:hypothetical protein